MKQLQTILSFLLASFFLVANANAAENEASLSQLLARGDEQLMANDVPKAIKTYEEGVQLIELLRLENPPTSSTKLTDAPALMESLSIYTNLGTAYSVMMEYNPTLYQSKTIQAYRKALQLHQERVDNGKRNEIKNKDGIKTINQVAAQAAFFLGMEYQDLAQFDNSMNAYGLAYTLDNNHWASMANLGALFHDFSGGDDEQFSFAKRMEEALTAYNKAYEILTQTTEEPTDYPNDVNFILSQLQYRIGIILSHDLKRTCLHADTQDEVDCQQMATYAFQLAVDYDGSNQPAKHMLASLTADATVVRASNEYVTELFEQYAKNFEHSLVDELGYNGYERLRRGFNRAFGGEENVPNFPLVVDAGCGTGLVGEQFRNVSHYLIGADLSESIIQEAQNLRPHLYDHVYVGDVLELFESYEKKPQAINLIVAADSYIYFGDLIPLFQAMSKGLMPDGEGFLAFTLENVSHENEKSLTETSPNWRWQLTPSGRFAHRKEYVEYVAEMNSLQIVHYEPLEGFRYEKGVPVRGHIFVMKSKETNDEL